VGPPRTGGAPMPSGNVPWLTVVCGFLLAGAVRAVVRRQLAP
jgi:hypothetical protein